MVAIKKRNKSTRMHGRRRGTHGGGARKKRKGSGHRGGIGMAGTGKRGDQKKTLVLNLYGHNYFGKQGITSRGTERDTRLRINIMQIVKNIENFVEKGIAKKTKEGYEIVLRDYKLLGTGEANGKMIITCSEASKSAIEKIEKKGGKIIFERKSEEENLSKKESKKIASKNL